MPKKANSQFKKEVRTRNWWFILYPESAPADWKERLDELHIQYAVSPLHDKDVNPTGEIKKPHWHVILMFEGVKSYQQVKEITDSLNAPIPQAVNGLVGTVRYLIHKDNPDKYQYNKTEIICGGGFDVADLLNRSPSDKRAIIREICEFIRANDIIEFHELSDYALDTNDDWFDVLTNGYTLYFTSIIASRRHSDKLQQKREERYLKLKRVESENELKNVLKIDDSTPTDSSTPESDHTEQG